MMAFSLSSDELKIPSSFQDSTRCLGLKPVGLGYWITPLPVVADPSISRCVRMRRLQMQDTFSRVR